MLSKLVAAGLLITIFQALAADGKVRVEVPARFVADQIYVELVTSQNQKFELYTDSGGGSLLFSRRAAERLGLHTMPLKNPDVLAELGADATEADSPTLRPGLPPLPSQAYVVTKASQMPEFPEQGDGVVGAAYFAGGVWTWDYPRHRLWREANTWNPANGTSVISLGFKTDSDGSRSTNFPRITAEIGGVNLSVLLDTGAETYLTPAAKLAIGDGLPEMRSTSMIQSSIFDQWRSEHPDWQYIPNAQVATHADMIKVPNVTVAGLHAGPVWFTRRSDRNYSEFMSSMTDQPVVGSLGGNAFHRFSMTIDYRKSRASFSMVP